VSVTVEQNEKGVVCRVESMTLHWMMKRSGLGGDRYDGDEINGWLRVAPEDLVTTVDVPEGQEPLDFVVRELSHRLGMEVRAAMIAHVKAIHGGGSDKTAAALRAGGTSARASIGDAGKGVPVKNGSATEEVY